MLISNKGEEPPWWMIDLRLRTAPCGWQMGVFSVMWYSKERTDGVGGGGNPLEKSCCDEGEHGRKKEPNMTGRVSHPNSTHRA